MADIATRPNSVLRFFGLVLVAAALGLSGPSVAADTRHTEREVQAAFLYRLLFFVDWPQEAAEVKDEPVRVGILGEDPFGDALLPMTTRRLDDRPITVEHVQALDGLGRFDLLYVSDSEVDRFQEILAQVDGAPVLTVGDSKAFMDAGGVLRFTSSKGRVSLEISRSAARVQDLRLSSSLLDMAEVVP